MSFQEPDAVSRPDSSQNILVTGGAGFIGSHLVQSLVGRGSRVVVLDDLTTGSRENLDHDWAADVEFVEGSTTDAELVERLVSETDVTFHLASAVGVQLVVSNPLDSLLKNVRGTDNVMGAIARHGKRLLFTSTSEVYGKNSSGALDEDADRVLGSPFKARWCYETSKAFGECLAHSLHREQGAAATVVRLFNTVGPRQTGRYGMVVPTFVRQALEGRPITVYGDGSQTRCFAHVFDSVRAILSLVDHPGSVGNVFNIGASMEIPIIELARRVIDHTESDSEIEFVAYDDAYDQGFEELGRRKPDTTAIRELTGWEPTLTVDDAIRDVIAHERARQGGSPLAA
ncbi:MAG: UDP-glucose 4-epimerase [Solirubrobacteraceae bacterium]|jgi:UDP-glucose 4-epimerase|nr:UDP-glucose 4-epimerase [Solirubrobacteraceae bacterium]